MLSLKKKNKYFNLKINIFKFNINFIQLIKANCFQKNIVSAETFPAHN